MGREFKVMNNKYHKTYKNKQEIQKIIKISSKMVLKVGINGFGRIGRLVLRASVENKPG